MLLVIYLCILFSIMTAFYYLMVGAKESKNIKVVSDFHLYKKQLNAGQVFGTFYASGMSLATVFIAFMQLTPFLGIKLVWAAVFYSMGHVLLWFLIPKIKNATENNNTLHGYLFQRFSSNFLRNSASLSTIIGFLGVFATELLVGSLIFGALIGSEAAYWLAFVTLSCITIAYSLLGGFRAVVKTDRVQSTAVIGASIAIAFIAYFYGKDESGVLIPEELMSSFMMPGLLMVNFFLINVLFPIIDMSAWQRVSASESVASAKTGVIKAVIMFMITWGLILFAGMSLSEFSSNDATGGLIFSLTLFAKESVVTALIAGLIFAGFVAALVSTADTFLIASGQTISMDVVDKQFYEKTMIPSEENGLENEEIKVINKTRLWMLISSIIGLLVCVVLKLVGFSIAELVFAVYGSALALVPVVVFALFTPKNISLAKYGFAGGLSVLVGVVIGWTYGMLSVLEFNEGELIYSLAHVLDPILGAPSAYNSPTVAIISAFVMLLLGGMASHFFGKAMEVKDVA